MTKVEQMSPRYVNGKLRSLDALHKRAIALEDSKMSMYSSSLKEETCNFCGEKGNIFKTMHKDDCWLLKAAHLIYDLSNFRI